MSWFNQRKLKTLRIIVSLTFFFLILFLFSDPWNYIPSEISNVLTSIQLLPALVKLFTTVDIYLIGLLLIIILTILFGRVFCSSICPIGTIQDIIIYIKRKFIKYTPFLYKPPHFKFHYSLLLTIAILFSAGSMVLLNLLDPFSNFGRIITNTVEPVVAIFNNLIAHFLKIFQDYSVHPIRIREFSVNIFILCIIFLIVIILMSYYRGRLFCNLLCPAGAILGLLSRIALFKIAINNDVCLECGDCERVCKANCIEALSKKVDFSACINCFNCIHSCAIDGISYKIVSLKKYSPPEPKFDASKRHFIKEVVKPIAGLTIPLVIFQDSLRQGISIYEASLKNPISPPGSKSIQHFTSHCTACNLCVSVCPTHVLQPSFLEYGITGIFQPKMNYKVSYCNYECNACSQICPTGAILPIDVETKKEIQIGKAKFIKEDCVVVTNKKACASCSEHCPTKAVYMVPYEGKLLLPEVNNDICIGCGACEYACPTIPRKAIFVNANPIHQKAKKPVIRKIEESIERISDFPF